VGFLNGLLLFGALGALVPLIIHLLERRRVPRLAFPSLRFLRELNRRQTRRLRWQRLLLLALRMLLVALVAFALARPTLLGALASLFPEDAPRAVALLVDNSASMALQTESGSLREVALARAGAVLDQLGEQDEVFLYAVETEAVDLGGGPLTPALARELLAGWPAREGAARPRAALAAAMADLATRPQPRREIYLISDFAAATLDTAALPPAGDLRAFALPVAGEAPPNAGLTDLRLPVRPVLPGQPFRLGVQAAARGAADVEPFPVELELEGEHRGSASLAPGPGLPAWRELQVSLTTEGPVAGLWRKKRDRYAPDDALPFTLDVLPRLQVLLLTPPADAAPADARAAGRLGLAEHLARALDPYGGAQPDALSLRLAARPLERLGSGDLAGRNLVVLAGGAELDATRAELLADFVAGGGGLIVCPDEAGLADLARHLLPRLGGPRSLERVEGAEDRLGELDPEHPAFADFAEEHRRVLGGQPIWKVFRTRPGARAVPARLESGRPALLAWPHGQGRVRLFLFEAGPEGGELPYSSMFLPLVQELAQEAAGAGPAARALVDEPLSWPLDSLPAEGVRLQVLAPGDRLLPVRLDTASLPPRAVLDRTDRAGFYRLQERGPAGVRELGLAAAQAPPAEGLLRPLPPDSLPAALGLPDLVVVAPARELAAALHAGRYGKEIAAPLLLLAAALMALELWLGRGETAPRRD